MLIRYKCTDIKAKIELNLLDIDFKILSSLMIVVKKKIRKNTVKF